MYGGLQVFSPISFKPSASLGSIASSMQGALSSAQAGLGAGLGALSSLGSSNGLPVDNAGRKQASGTLASPAKFLVISPYTQGVGSRKGEQAYLTPKDALGKLHASLAIADAELAKLWEYGKMPDTALALIFFASLTPAGLAESLGNFNQVYPIKELEKTMRRAKGLATLEKDKFVIPPKRDPLAWGESCPQKNHTGQEALKISLGMVATVEGVAKASQGLASKLQALGKAEQAKIVAKQTALQSLNASMQGEINNASGLYLEGAGSFIARMLAKAPIPLGENFKCTTLLCWYGTKAQVGYYKESFGLKNPFEGLI